jgi:hypothetical protein
VVPLQIIEPTGTSTRPVTANIGQQVVTAINSSVVQHFLGTADLSGEAAELLKVVEDFGGDDAQELVSAVHEMEDTDARPERKIVARQRLKSFLLALQGKLEDAAMSMPLKYLETKVGLS